MKYYYWFPPCIFAAWPWHLNIHKPLKIKEAHLVHLACCYAQQRLQSVQSKILSHSEVKWELLSKQQNTISFPHARCWSSVDKYLLLELCCCCSENDILSSDLARCIPSQRCFRIQEKQKQRQERVEIFKLHKEKIEHSLVWYFAMTESVEGGVNWNLCSVALKSGNS